MLRTKKVPEFDFNEINTTAFLEAYEVSSIVVVKNVIPERFILGAQNRLFNFFESVLSKRNIFIKDNDTLDVVHQMAQQAMGEEDARYLLTIGKDLPVFKQIISCDPVISTIESLLKTKNIQSVDDSNVLRIDRPQSDLTNLPWHQDYPYNMLSLNAITAWIPIMPVDERMGRMRVISPKRELMPIEYSHKIKQEFHNSRYIKLKGLENLEEEFEAASIEVQEVLPGDMVLFDSLVLHRSGVNTSKKSRWVATARYGSLDDVLVAKRNYFTARAKYPNIFKNYHPDQWFEVD
ncbi:phytanoyl-CoA dioxygenase family protein [Pseudoalteromonas sp. MMG012]|uniref:phytanoyl-CoA dioxygenase family protein n=1 Tax=Pseudoalteromonas sp. MMG012 TaxID=2822686 RepID=UPI001B3A05E8|nr:phytanoyl-CoA dioxygenase family protein [Pseudoalteromonas sp. MMG012]MBQ4849018.1 phytanoyl-CoA dioxygenase family protein [Pseudoalteromonas sp. MMG012]